MQDGHQVHHRLLTCQRLSQGHLIMDVKLQHMNLRQVPLQQLGAGSLAAAHRHLPALLQQHFAHRGADETGTTQHQNIFHTPNLTPHTMCSAEQGQTALANGL